MVGRLDQYGAEPLEQQQCGTAGVEGVNYAFITSCQRCRVISPSSPVAAGGRGEWGHPPPGGTEQEWHLQERKYGILKFGRFWQIAICIADSNILHPLVSLNTPPVLRPHPQLLVVPDPTQSSVYTKKLTLLTRLIIHLLQNCRRSILYSCCFTGNYNSMFCTIHAFSNSA